MALRRFLPVCAHRCHPRSAAEIGAQQDVSTSKVDHFLFMLIFFSPDCGDILPLRSHSMISTDANPLVCSCILFLFFCFSFFESEEIQTGTINMNLTIAD